MSTGVLREMHLESVCLQDGLAHPRRWIRQDLVRLTVRHENRDLRHVRICLEERFPLSHGDRSSGEHEAACEIVLVDLALIQRKIERRHGPLAEATKCNLVVGHASKMLHDASHNLPELLESRVHASWRVLDELLEALKSSHDPALYIDRPPLLHAQRTSLGMRKCKDDLLVLQARPFEHQLAGQVLKIVGAGAKAMHEQHQQVRGVGLLLSRVAGFGAGQDTVVSMERRGGLEESAGWEVSRALKTRIQVRIRHEALLGLLSARDQLRFLHAVVGRQASGVDIRFQLPHAHLGHILVRQEVRHSRT
mmetsp:Transcript_15863/g.60418  ORF Transcript_15863/g.60418 Transcript_15863/m.60418 type:complete len:307 (+) Transcript_15863:1737-2657(+)